MADNRLWYKNDVGYLDNPKVAELVETNPNAVLLHQACIAYAKQHGTDGLVLMRVAMRRACAKQCDLDAAVASGLLEVVDDRHVMVHDYLEHQSSAEEDRSRSDKAKHAATARWSKKNDAPSNAGSNAPSNAGSNAEKSREEKSRSNPPGGSGKASPTPDATLPVIVSNPGPQQLVGEWIDHCNTRPPSRVIGQVSKELKILVDDGIEYEQIRAGLATWTSKSLHPSALASIVHEAANPARQSGPRSRVQQQQDSLMRQLEIARQLDAQEGIA